MFQDGLYTAVCLALVGKKKHKKNMTEFNDLSDAGVDEIVKGFISNH